jgi:hypothetical protein
VGGGRYENLKTFFRASSDCIKNLPFSHTKKIDPPPQIFGQALVCWNLLNVTALGQR